MERRHHDEVTRLMKTPAQARDAHLGAEHEVRGKVAQTHDHVRPDGANLFAQEWRADGNLLRLGIAIVWRAALDHIADIDVLASQSRQRQERVEVLAGSAHKWLALQILVAARALAHDHDASIWIAHAKHEVCTRLSQGTEHAVAHEVSNFFQPHLLRLLMVVARYVHNGHGLVLLGKIHAWGSSASSPRLGDSATHRSFAT